MIQRSCQKLIVLTLALLFLLAPTLSVAADSKDVPTPLVLVSEPNEISEGVYYVEEGKNHEPNTFTWVKGGSDGEGTALELNGKTQFIRLSTEKTNDLKEFTLSAWFKAKEGLQANQSFLLSVFQKNPEYHLTVSPYSENTDVDRNGIYLEFKDPQTEDITLYHKTTFPVSSAFPVEEWHHVAVKFSEGAISLYIDGSKYAEQKFENFSFDSTEWHRFILGGDTNSQGAFSGWLDEAYLYTEILDDNQIGLLAAGYEPKPGVAPPKDKEYVAIRPIVEIPNPTTPSASVLGLSPSFFAILGAGAALVLILALILSSYRKRQQVVPEEDHP